MKAITQERYGKADVLEFGDVEEPVVGEHDVLYGSVTSGDVAEFLKAKGVEIDKRKVLLDEPVKKLGEHDVRIKLHPEVTATLKLLVSKEG
jgi:large subunit ribosomal protein L9